MANESSVSAQFITSVNKRTTEFAIQTVIFIDDESQKSHLIAVHLMDDTWLASLIIVQNKTCNCVALKMLTANLAKTTVPHAELYSLNTTNNG